MGAEDNKNFDNYESIKQNISNMEDKTRKGININMSPYPVKTSKLRKIKDKLKGGKKE